MNKLLIALALCPVLAACKQQEAGPTTDTAAPPAAGIDSAASAPPAADQAAASANADLPKECQDFLDRAKACLAKGNTAMAAQFQSSIDTYKAQWQGAADKTSLGPVCTQANAQFDSTAAALKCE